MQRRRCSGAAATKYFAPGAHERVYFLTRSTLRIFLRGVVARECGAVRQAAPRSMRRCDATLLRAQARYA